MWAAGVAKAGKNRLHLDLIVDDLDRATGEIQTLGGRWLEPGMVRELEGFRWRFGAAGRLALARWRTSCDRPRTGYRSGWAIVSITAVAARIKMSFSPGATSTP